MSMGKSRKLLTLVLALMMVGSLVAGCAGDDGETAEGEGGSTETVKVVIGVGAPLTDGAVALGEGMVRGTKLAVADANESQELKDLGIEIEVVEGDDKGDPTTGGNVATQFVSNPNLVGVMGHLNSGVTRVAVKIYNQGGVVQVSPANTAVDLTQMGMDNYFRVCATDDVQGPVAADYAFKDLGKKAAYVVDDSTPYGVGLADEWAKQFEANGGKVLGREKTSDKDTDFKALVSKIKSLNPDLVYYGGIYNSGALLSKQLKEGGVSVPTMAGDGCFDPEWIKIAGAANAEGDMASNIGLPLDSMPKGQDFLAASKEMFPGEEPAAYDAYSYDAATTIIKGIIAAAKELGADKVTTAEGKAAIIAAIKGTDFEGVTGQVKFDEKGDTLNKKITVYGVQNGAWAPVSE